MEGKGYWYKNKKLFDLECGKHIGFIIDNHEMFGLTLKEITTCYRNHAERFRMEGMARKDLIIQATVNGWIRIREYIRPWSYWSIQCYDYIKQTNDLQWLIKRLIEIEALNLNDEVIFTEFSNNRKYAYPYIEGGIQRFLEDSGSYNKIIDTN